MARGIIAAMEEYENQIPAFVCTESHFKDQELMITLARLVERECDLVVATEGVKESITSKFDSLKETVDEYTAHFRNLVSVNSLLKNKLIRLKSDIMGVEGDKTIVMSATPFFKFGSGEVVRDTKEYIKELNKTCNVLIELMKAQQKLTQKAAIAKIGTGVSDTHAGVVLLDSARDFIDATKAAPVKDNNYLSPTYLGMFKLEAYLPDSKPKDKETSETKFDIVKHQAKSDREGGEVHLTINKKEMLEIVNVGLACVTTLVEVNGFVTRVLDKIIIDNRIGNYLGGMFTGPLYLLWDEFRIYHNLLIEATRNSSKMFLLAKQNGENVANLAKRFIKA